jgi:hypothetical protein
MAPNPLPNPPYRAKSGGRCMMTERGIRLYANHLALTVRRRGSRLTLSERYGAKKK